MHSLENHLFAHSSLIRNKLIFPQCTHLPKVHSFKTYLFAHRAGFAHFSKVVVFVGNFECTSKEYGERETSLCSPLKRETSLALLEREGAFI